MAYIDSRPELAVLLETEQRLSQAIEDLRVQQGNIRDFIRAELGKDDL
jgi:hypothetical protein